MFKQRCLEFVEPDRWERLWDRFPEPAREEVRQHCARLMARSWIERIRALKTKQEQTDEPHHD
jgi:hypothetical protein